MAEKKRARDIGLPYFEGWRARSGNVFDLSSHTRAREALEFGLAIDQPGFNVFVLGADNAGRMTQTLDFVKSALTHRPTTNDWVYLNNFLRPHRPKAYRLPPGVGRALRSRMHAFATALQETLDRTFESEDYQGRVSGIDETVQEEMRGAVERLETEAKESGLTILRSDSGFMVSPLDAEGEPTSLDQMPEDRQDTLRAEAERIAEDLHQINRDAARKQTEANAEIAALEQEMADEIVSDLLKPIIEDFQVYPGLNPWLASVKADVLDNLNVFQAAVESENEDSETAIRNEIERRYSVNLIIDNHDAKHPDVVLEANPTYDNLFGYIEYRSVGGELTTDFSMVRPGALHRANGGVLVLRAEAIAQQADSWEALKSALRDNKIRIEERHRKDGLRIAGSPTPKGIPLDIKVVIVGAPKWYYTFFSVDSDFPNLFKVKADIDPDMKASPENIAVYAGILRSSAKRLGLGWLSHPVLARLVGKAARLAEDRERLSARYELLIDLMIEARHLAQGEQITIKALERADAMRRRRNARTEDRLLDQVAKGMQLIDVTGQQTGQINGLTVVDSGDYSFGTVSRITARASVGRLGLINIERQVDMGGPLQQKGVYVLEGYLSGCFARILPLSFNCTVTFEQTYGGVDGDSASLAELLAVLSDLADCPIRQDIGISGSVNQRGEVQPVGSLREKVEAFFHACQVKGALTGSQGVVVPAANARSLIFDRDVEQAVTDGQFHIWTVATVDEALALFSGLEPGQRTSTGQYPSDSFYGRIVAKITEFDQILRQRESALANTTAPR